MDLGLQGARVIVTGGSRGIGAASARLFAAEGARVAVIARTGVDVEAVAAETGGIPVVSDLSSAAGVAAAMDEAMSGLGGVDVLVNNAGSSTGGSILDADEQAWQETIDLKLMGYVRTMRAVLPTMQQQRSGVVVNVLGVAGTEASPTYALASIVTALIHVTASAGQLVAPNGVRVVAVHPGPTATDRLMEMVANAAETRCSATEFLKEGWAEPKKWPGPLSSLLRSPPGSPTPASCTSTEAWPPRSESSSPASCPRPFRKP